MKRLLDILMWIMFGVSFMISILTMIVVFGIAYTGFEMFATFLPLQISLGSSLILWAVNSFVNPYVKYRKDSAIIVLLLGVGLLLFTRFGVY